MNSIQAIIAQLLDLDRSRFQNERDWLSALNRGIFLCLYMIAWGSYGVGYYLLGNSVAAIICLVIGSGVTIAGLLSIRYFHNTLHVMTIIHYAALVCLLALGHVTGGLESPIYAWLFTISICSYLLTNARIGLLFSMATIVGCVLNYASHYWLQFTPSSEFFDPNSPYFRWFRLINYASSLAITSSLTYIFAKNQFEAYEKTVTANAQILEQKAVLDTQNQRLLDLSDRLQAQKNLLEETHQKLITSDEQKTKFFQNISHELRTPLTLILSSLQEKSLATEAAAQPVQIAQRNANRLLRLVNQLLDFQKLAAGQGELKLREMDLLKLVEQIADYFKIAARDKRIQFYLDRSGLGPRPGVPILGEVDALEKIIFNFLSNAMKYTPHEGRIRIRLSCDRFRVRVSVEDNGPGIPADQMNKLFQVFSQVDSEATRRVGGTGLGLALSKELAERMHGTVGVSSEVGKGSTFWLELPLADSSIPRIPACLVTENLLLAKRFRDYVEAQGHTLEIAASAEEARAKLDLARIDLLILDQSLRELGAFPLLELAASRHPDGKRILLQNPEQVQDFPKSFNLKLISRMLGADIDPEDRGKLDELLHASRVAAGLSSHVTFLLIDDNPTCIRQGIQALEKITSFSEIMVASSGDEARKFLATYEYRVVLADENIGAVKGSDLLTEVKRRSPKTFCVLVTSDSSARLVHKASNSDCIDHIIFKPLSTDEIKNALPKDIFDNKKESVKNDEDPVSFKGKDWLLGGISGTQAIEEPKPTESPGFHAQQIKILVADDLFDMRRLVCKTLAAEEYALIEAKDGQEALQLAGQHLPDLIITDWMMPKLTGPELLQKLKADPKLSNIPTVLLTARGDDVSRIQAMQLGAIAFLSKPFEAAELMNTVNNLIRLKENEKKVIELNRNMREHVLQRFFPAHILKRICDGELAFDNTNQLMPVTVLFADLCEFTRTSAVLGPEKISEILNAFLYEMSEIAFNKGGTVDKFIGDAVMLIFGAPVSSPSQTQVMSAVSCATEMHEALERLNQVWTKKGLPEFKMRIGIHHGPAVVGMFGCERRSDYTVIGPTVNVAARIESAATPGSTFVSEVVRSYLPLDVWEDAGSFRLKGIDGETKLFRIKLGRGKHLAA